MEPAVQKQHKNACQYFFILHAGRNRLQPKGASLRRLSACAGKPPITLLTASVIFDNIIQTIPHPFLRKRNDNGISLPPKMLCRHIALSKAGVVYFVLFDLHSVAIEDARKEKSHLQKGKIMLFYIWPIALAVASNIVYHICAKSVPENISPFFSLTVAYLVSACLSIAMFFATDAEHSILKEFGKMNWAPPVLGLVIVGLEVGFIYAYKAGWQVSTASIVQSSFLAIALIVAGTLLYREALTWNKLLGICICMVGLIFINLK